MQITHPAVQQEDADAITALYRREQAVWRQIEEESQARGWGRILDKVKARTLGAQSPRGRATVTFEVDLAAVGETLIAAGLLGVASGGQMTKVRSGSLTYERHVHLPVSTAEACVCAEEVTDRAVGIAAFEQGIVGRITSIKVKRCHYCLT